jgi:excisionase family DNA binding protein
MDNKSGGRLTDANLEVSRQIERPHRGGAALSNLRTEQPAAQGPNWLTPKDVQEELRIGERLCYRLLRSGELPSVRVGNLYRVRREVLEELKEQARMKRMKKAESLNPAQPRHSRPKEYR